LPEIEISISLPLNHVAGISPEERYNIAKLYAIDNCDESLLMQINGLAKRLTVVLFRNQYRETFKYCHFLHNETA